MSEQFKNNIPSWKQQKDEESRLYSSPDVSHKETIVATLPEDLTEEDTLRAEFYLRWLQVRNKKELASPQEREWFDKISIVAGRPLFISKLSEKEAERFEKAIKYVQPKTEAMS